MKVCLFDPLGHQRAARLSAPVDVIDLDQSFILIPADLASNFGTRPPARPVPAVSIKQGCRYRSSGYRHCLVGRDEVEGSSVSPLIQPHRVIVFRFDGGR